MRFVPEPANLVFAFVYFQFSFNEILQQEFKYQNIIICIFQFSFNEIPNDVEVYLYTDLDTLSILF